MDATVKTESLDEQRVEDAYDPENPGSENEKDVEGENGTKPTIEEDAPQVTKNQPQVVVTDANDEPEVKQVNPAESPKDAKKLRGPTAVRGVPRARRGRRH